MPSEHPNQGPDNTPGGHARDDAQFPPNLVRDLKSLYERRIVVPESVDARVSAMAAAHVEGLRRRRMRLVIVRTAGGLAAAAALALGVFMMFPGTRPAQNPLNSPLASGSADKSDLAMARTSREAASFGEAVPAGPAVPGTPVDNAGGEGGRLRVQAIAKGAPPASGQPVAPPETPAGVATSPSRQLAGDVNNDGAVNIVDALLLARSLEGRAVLPDSANPRDLNNDGVVDSEDVKAIAQSAVRLNTPHSAALLRRLSIALSGGAL